MKPVKCETHKVYGCSRCGKTATVSDSPESLGWVQNGVATEAAKCIGCGQFFEELRIVAYDAVEEMAVCQRCEKSMEP